MKEVTLKSTIKVYDTPEELSENDQVLLQLAKTSLDHAYAPYSKFKVGAAILLQNGTMLGGSNQENAAYPLCLCAERIAIGAADSQHPKVPITAIAVTAKSNTKTINQPIAPCGACRQVLCETEHKHQQSMRVILQGESGQIFEFFTAKDLLPLGFDSAFL